MRARRCAKAAGFKIIYERGYSPSTTDFAPMVRAVQAAKPGPKGVLPKDYNRPALDKVMLGELIDLVSGSAHGRARRQGEGHPWPRLRIFPFTLCAEWNG